MAVSPGYIGRGPINRRSCLAVSEQFRENSLVSLYHMGGWLFLAAYGHRRTGGWWQMIFSAARVQLHSHATGPDTRSTKGTLGME